MANKGQMKLFKEGNKTKFLATFFYFGDEVPTDKSHKLQAPIVKRTSKFRFLPNAEEVLGLSWPEGFVTDAKAHGWTLVECLDFAVAKFADEKDKSSRGEGAEDPVRLLARLLVDVRPNASPVELLSELRTLVDEKGDEAVKFLEELLKNETPRDDRGYIYLRKVTK